MVYGAATTRAQRDVQFRTEIMQMQKSLALIDILLTMFNALADLRTGGRFMARSLIR